MNIYIYFNLNKVAVSWLAVTVYQESCYGSLVGTCSGKASLLCLLRGLRLSKPLPEGCGRSDGETQGESLVLKSGRCPEYRQESVLPVPAAGVRRQGRDQEAELSDGERRSRIGAARRGAGECGRSEASPGSFAAVFLNPLSSPGSSVGLRERGADQQKDQEHLGVHQENQELLSGQQVSGADRTRSLTSDLG